MKHILQTQYQIQEIRDSKETLLVVESVKAAATFAASANSIGV
jgi:hypothetical protein